MQRSHSLYHRQSPVARVELPVLNVVSVLQRRRRWRRRKKEEMRLRNTAPLWQKVPVLFSRVPFTRNMLPQQRQRRWKPLQRYCSKSLLLNSLNESLQQQFVRIAALEQQVEQMKRAERDREEKKKSKKEKKSWLNKQEKRSRRRRR